MVAIENKREKKLDIAVTRSSSHAYSQPSDILFE